MIKNILFTFLLFTTLLTFGQKKGANAYKYIVVPEKFYFLKTSDQYKTSSLTKFLLQKKGFNFLLSNEILPNALAENRCLALTANLLESSSMFSTKIAIVLKDCYGNDVYSSKEGKSKLKEYKKAYQDAIRKADATMKTLKFSETENNLRPLQNG